MVSEKHVRFFHFFFTDKQFISLSQNVHYFNFFLKLKKQFTWERRSKAFIVILLNFAIKLIILVNNDSPDFLPREN
jgi:hypothetical protein